MARDSAVDVVDPLNDEVETLSAEHAASDSSETPAAILGRQKVRGHAHTDSTQQHDVSMQHEQSCAPRKCPAGRGLRNCEWQDADTTQPEEDV